MNTCQIQCNVSPIMGFVRHTKLKLTQFCMPDEARDGQNVALNLTSVHGVLDCPKKNQANTVVYLCVHALYIVMSTTCYTCLCWKPFN